MPLKGKVSYRIKKTDKGNVRLAFRDGQVVEAKNLKTGAIHTEKEFKKDKVKKKKLKIKQKQKARVRRITDKASKKSYVPVRRV